MTINDAQNQPHPLDMLEAYALSALDDAEAAQVEAHLDECGACNREVTQLQRTAARLGESVERRAPPAVVRARLLETVAPEDARPVAAGSVASKSRKWVPDPRFVLPIAAAVVAGLFSLTVVMNVRLSDRTDVLEMENATLTAQATIVDDRTDALEMENATLTAQAASVAEVESRTAERVRQLQITSYWLANPNNQSLTLRPPSGSGNSRGILLVRNDGRSAMLLVLGMNGRPATSTYQVWLMRGGDRVQVGTLEVDDRGWGTTTVWPKESIFQFDKVELVTETSSGAVASPAGMVLEANIPASQAPRMVTLMPVQ